MSNMTDYEAGQLVQVVEQLGVAIEKMNKNTTKLTNRIEKLEKQLAKGKGMFAGAMLLAMGLGGLGGQVFSSWLK
jgi:hypothetical protein